MKELVFIFCAIITTVNSFGQKSLRADDFCDIINCIIDNDDYHNYDVNLYVEDHTMSFSESDKISFINAFNKEYAYKPDSTVFASLQNRASIVCSFKKAKFIDSITIMSALDNTIIINRKSFLFFKISHRVKTSGKRKPTIVYSFSKPFIIGEDIIIKINVSDSRGGGYDIVSLLRKISDGNWITEKTLYGFNY